ncbi:MAG: excinuclease ABC subunit UvrC [Actinomycetes bacterium]|jgi:excinuclease ABC subunit C|nr:excinuclease ABC subunit UvrC [Actinomycetota bacterium]
MADPQSYRPKDIPDSPGVYRFFDEKDVVIYVGKAISLKSRLNSYFQNNLAEKTRKMVNAAVRVDWTLVNTEVEALQLEFSWIKEENPHFNVQFKDDKSYPFLAVSIKDEFPRIYITRSQKQKGVKHIGPFAHAWALRSTYEVLLKLFPVRSCTESNFLRAQKSNRQCLLGDIGKCAAPCVGWVTPEEHQEIAKNLIKFLDSNPESVTEKLTDEMLTASAAEQFEKAGKLRDQLQALTKAQESTDAALSEEITADFIAMHEDITHAAFSIFIVRHGRITGSRSWVVDLQEVPEGDSVMDAALPKIYHDFEVPREILINQPITSEAGVIEWLSQKHGNSVEVKVPQRGEKFELLQTVKRNANQALIQFLSKRANDAGVSGRALEEIATALDLAELPLRIECFDISNIQGTSVVASMVVFEDGQSKKSEYRRFSIDDEAGFDDTRAMHHVITRRFKRYLAEKDLDLTELEMSGANRPKFAYPPQLIIVDGGVGQVNAAARALSELGITDIALCGLAKRLEEVWLPEVKTPIIFPRHSEALYLFQRIRDEAHRFAITFHRSKRSKLMLESLLDEIPTLGTARISALLEHFGSVSAIRKANESQISQIPGIGEKIAKIIVDFLAQQSAPENVNTSTGEIT